MKPVGFRHCFVQGNSQSGFFPQCDHVVAGGLLQRFFHIFNPKSLYFIQQVDSLIKIQAPVEVQPNHDIICHPVSHRLDFLDGRFYASCLDFDLVGPKMSGCFLC